DDLPLPLPESSWHIGRVVKMLEGHWDTIMQFAATIDAERAEKLDMLAQSRDEDDDSVSIDDLRQAIEFINQLIQHIQISPNSLEASENNPDSFENDVYVDMLQAVKAVFQESLRLDQPFRAWLEYS